MDIKQISAFENCDLDVIHLILELCDYQSILNLSRVNSIFLIVTKAYIYRRLSFRFIDGRFPENRNAFLLKTMHLEENVNLRNSVREIEIYRDWYKSEVRNALLLNAVEALVPRLENLHIIKIEIPKRQDFIDPRFLTVLHERAKVSKLRLYYIGAISRRILLEDNSIGYAWYSVTTSINETDNPQFLGRLLSLAPNIKELDVTFHPPRYQWPKPDKDPLWLYSQSKYNCPSLRKLRLIGYHIGYRYQRPQPLYHVFPKMCSSLEVLEIDHVDALNRQNVNLSRLRSFTYVGNQSDGTMRHGSQELTELLEITLKDVPLRELVFKYQGALAANALWRKLILPFAGTLEKLGLYNGTTARRRRPSSLGSSELDLLGDPESLEMLASKCEKLRELDIDVIRIATLPSFPVSLLSKICQFPALKNLTLHLPVKALGASAYLKPEVNYQSVAQISNLFTRLNNRYFDRLRVVRGDDEDRKTIHDYEEHKELEIFDVEYSQGLDGQRETLVRARMVEKYQRLLDNTDMGDPSYNTIAKSLLACQARAGSRPS